MRRLNSLIALIFITLISFNTYAENSMNPKVKLTTSMGDIVLALDAEKAPITVENFTTYVKNGHYDGVIFHRIIPGFMVQVSTSHRDRPFLGTGTDDSTESSAGNSYRGTSAIKRACIMIVLRDRRRTPGNRFASPSGSDDRGQWGAGVDASLILSSLGF